VLRLDQTAALFEALVAVFKRRWSLDQRPDDPAGGRGVRGRGDHLPARRPGLGGSGSARDDRTAGDLPGAALTMAVVKLSAAEMITGASRLVAGTLRLLLLGFGIVGAVQVVGLPSADALCR
jgi:hypothetical protein